MPLKTQRRPGCIYDPTQAELADGARPVLAAIMAHDRPAAATMVLAISGLPKVRVVSFATCL